MVLIISEKGDITTDRVIDWLIHMGITDIVRINSGDSIFIETISLSSQAETYISLSYNDKRFSIDQVKFFWYRRGFLNFNIKLPQISDNDRCNSHLKKISFLEWKKCKEYIVKKLEEKAHLGDFFNTDTNKIQNLEKAQALGFKIPKTLITQNGKTLKTFTLEQSKLITKPINECFKYSNDNYELFSGVNEINSNTIDFADCYSSPQLLQQRVEKWIEIRVFVFFEKLFSMAIFSQNNEQTRIDYRIHDFNNDPPFA